MVDFPGKETIESMKKAAFSLVKWVALSAAAGVVAGLIMSGFASLIAIVTEFRLAHMWMLLLLPAAGCLIVFLYRAAGHETDHGTNMVIEAVREDAPMPYEQGILVLTATVLTHAFGGSTGREGAALQLGGSAAAVGAGLLHLNERDKKLLLMAGMSAAFAALFGTPLAASVLPLEFVTVGEMFYPALVPCVLASFTAHAVAVKLGTAHLAAPYAVAAVPSLYSTAMLKALVLGIGSALAAVLFINALHITDSYFDRWFKGRPYIRVMAGGALVAALACALGTQDYCGLSSQLIHDSFAGNAAPYAFLLKILFTCFTLEAGFKGGEIVPSFVIGASLGCLLSGFLSLPADVCCAAGMCGVFCAITNSPICSLLIALELFGPEGMGYYAVSIAIAYSMSGYYGVFGAQRIRFSKTGTEAVDVKAGDLFKKHHES
ncbi:MAG: chloride channel protein [Lachnospiraceae bacterium]|nr:chloride channel protein [Lachnospiraceae bacterium]